MNRNSQPVTRDFSENSGGAQLGPKTLDKRAGILGMLRRFSIGVLAGLATAGIAELLLAYPLSSRLDSWAVLSLVEGLLLGPAGLIGSTIVFFFVTIAELPKPAVWALVHTANYLLMGLTAYSIFRFVPRLDRGLSNLRSYIGFLCAVFTGSIVLAGIGSINLFPNSLADGTIVSAVVYWFSSAVTSLLIVAPFLLVVTVWAFRPWIISMPREGSRANDTAPTSAKGRHITNQLVRRDIAYGTATVLATTIVVSPLVHIRPQFGGWFALLFIVPILWGSFNRGLRGGVLVASGSGVAYLIGSAISSTILVREVTHEEILGQFIGLVVFSLIGAITGAFQQARLSAETALIKSNVELEKRHESLALVNRLANRLKRTLDVETITQEAVDAVVQLSNPPSVAIYLLDNDGTTLELKAHHGFDDEVLDAGKTLPLEGSLSGIALSSREPLFSQEISSDERIAPSMRELLVRTGSQSAMSLPLVFEHEALGTINLLFNDQMAVTVEDQSSFSTIGRTVALALVNARHVGLLEHLAFHDELTGLPNRKGLHRWFSEGDLSGYGDRRKLGLILIDIDRFKEVNDALGHHVGDQVLTLIGPRIKSAHSERSPSIFRLSGNEFAVLIPSLNEANESEKITENLLATLTQPFQVSGLDLKIEGSAGIALFPDDASNSSELLRCAGVAVNHAKRTSNHIVRYSPLLDQHTPERLALASELGRAIRDNQLTLFFQPQVTMTDSQPIGFEALVRWQHPTLGLLPPDRFIPVAEVGELIQPLTYWVIEEALKQLKIWQRGKQDLTMAINLSTRNLIDRSCAKKISEIVTRAEVDPKTVEFELTETALVVDPEAAATTLSAISDFGPRIVIDDFGTGYSSLAFLKRYPIHGLKIDRSFVGDMLSDRPSRAIVRASVQLADDLGLTLVAEGVENPGTVKALCDMGCPLGQGFYFLHPSSARSVEHRLSDWGIGPPS